MANWLPNSFWSAARPPLSFICARQKKRKRRPRRTPKPKPPLDGISSEAQNGAGPRTPESVSMSPDNADRQRLRLLDRLLPLPAAHLGAVEDFILRLPAGSPPAAPDTPPPVFLPADRDWPH